MPNSQTRTILVHVDRIWASRLRFRVGVYLTRTQASDVVRTGTGFPSRTRETELLILLRLRLVQQLLVSLQTLSRCTPDYWRYRSPLCGHELGKVQQLLVFRLARQSRQSRPYDENCSWLTFDHSVFLMEGSSHSYQRALHCLGVLRTSRDDIRALIAVLQVVFTKWVWVNEGAPLVFPILRNCRLQHLVLRVLIIRKLDRHRQQ